jgi:hypothetical protein
MASPKPAICPRAQLNVAARLLPRPSAHRRDRQQARRQRQPQAPPGGPLQLDPAAGAQLWQPAHDQRVIQVRKRRRSPCALEVDAEARVEPMRRGRATR